MKIIITYSPVLAFFLLMLFNAYQILFVSAESCACVVQYADSFLMNEILFTIISTYILATSIRFKLCYYNKLAAIGLMFTSVLNIIAISTPLDYSIYNSIITQILLILIMLTVVYFLIKKI